MSQEFENKDTKTFDAQKDIAPPTPVAFKGQKLSPNKTVIIQPSFLDYSGGKAANTMQRNGKTFIQDYYEQYQKLGQIVKKVSGGKIVVKINYPKISSTSLANKGLEIKTK